MKKLTPLKRRVKRIPHVRPVLSDRIHSKVFCSIEMPVREDLRSPVIDPISFNMVYLIAGASHGLAVPEPYSSSTK